MFYRIIFVVLLVINLTYRITSGDPTEFDTESEDMSKAAKQYKPQQKEATEKHKKALAEYVQNIKDRCDTLMQGQMEAMRTGIPCLVPPYLTTIKGEYKEANARYRDVTLMPNDKFVYEDNPVVSRPQRLVIAGCEREAPKIEVKYRNWMQELYGTRLPYMSSDYLKIQLDQAEAELAELIRLFNNKYFLLRLGFGSSYYRDLTMDRFVNTMKELTKELNYVRHVSISINFIKTMQRSTNSLLEALATRIDYINKIMIHNFGIISDLNVHFLSEERQYQDCINAKKHNIVLRAAGLVFETILLTLVGAAILVIFSMFAFVLLSPIIMLTVVCWPATVAIIGTIAAIWLTFKLCEGIKIYKTQTPYYIAPNKEYQKLIKRHRKPLGARLTDFFRG